MSFRDPSVQKILLLAGFLDLFAVSLILTQFQTYIHQLGVSPFLNGLIGSLYGAVQLFSGPLVGNWSDVQGRKLILQICLLITAISYFLLGYSSAFLFIIISRFFSGVFKHSQTLCRAYIAESIPGNEKSGVLGYFNSASSLGFIIGPALGGHIADWNNGFFWICTLSSIMFFINFCIISLALPEDEPCGKTSDDSFKSFPIFDSECWKNHWDLLIIRFFLSFSVLMYRSNLSLLLLENFNLTNTSIGYIISFQGIVSSISGFFVGVICGLFPNNSKLLLYTSILQAVALCGLTFAPSIWLLLAFFIPLGASNSISRVCITSITVNRCHKLEIGTMIGISQSVTSIARMLSPFSAGVVHQLSMYGPGLGGIVSSCIGCSVWAFNLYKPYFRKSNLNKEKLS